jgi:hypothetical protein
MGLKGRASYPLDVPPLQADRLDGLVFPKGFSLVQDLPLFSTEVAASGPGALQSS